jgi:hypothetical protein
VGGAQAHDDVGRIVGGEGVAAGVGEPVVAVERCGPAFGVCEIAWIVGGLVQVLATAFAQLMGSRCGRMTIAVPSLITSVTDAAAASATKGSSIEAYSRGTVSASGKSVDSGMCECSETQKESKPISSARRATVAGFALVSVANMLTPIFMSLLLRAYADHLRLAVR